MKLLSIEINNCFKYGNEDNIFNFDNPLTLIIGSNGAGKSSIFEAVSYALFEKTIRWGITHDEIIRRGELGGYVTLKFQNKGINYELKRGRNKKMGIGFIKFICLDDKRDLTCKSTKETNEDIIEVIGFDFDVFKNSVLFGQYDFKKIVSLQPADRLDLLSDLLNLQILKKCYEIAESKHLSLKSHIDQLSVTIDAAKYKDLKDEIKNLREIREAVVNELNTQNQSFTGTQETLQALNLMRDSALKAKSSIKSINATIEAKEEELKRINKIVEKDSIKQIPILEKRYKQSKEDYSKISGLENLSSELDEKIIELREIFAVGKNNRRIIKNKIKLIKDRKNCLECGRVYNDEVKQNLISIQTKKLIEVDKKREGIIIILREKSDKNKNLKQKINQIKNRETPEVLMEKIVALEKSKHLEEEKNKIEEGVKGLKSQLAQYNGILQEVKEKGYTLEKLEKVNDRLLEIKGIVSENVGKIKHIDSVIEDLEEKIKKIKMDRNKLEKYISKGEIFDFITNMFSRAGGIKQIIVENILPRLNHKINKYLEILTNESITIDFTTDTKTKTGKDKDKLEIMIWTPQGRAEFESYSGGEKQSLILAIGFGFAELAAESVGADCKFILLDEVFSSLDTKARARLIQMLYALRKKFENIVLISHIPELKAQIPNIITVKRKQGMSRILVGEI